MTRRGTKYPFRGELLSPKEIADRGGVKLETVYTHKKRGTLESIGQKRGPKEFTVVSAGRHYKNATECAEANNVKRSAVYSALANVREDHIGERNNPNFKKEIEEVNKND